MQGILALCKTNIASSKEYAKINSRFYEQLNLGHIRLQNFLADA